MRDAATTDDARMRAAVQHALRLATVALPHLAGLAHSVRISVNARVPTIGVFPSGRLVANPRWFAALAQSDAAFVVAHELLHLALGTHERAEGTDHELFNVAHDLIINDVLEAALGRPAPADGLRHPNARYLSAEQLAREIGGAGGDAASWGGAAPGVDTALGAALRAAGLAEPAGGTGTGSDVLPERLEREWFPHEAPSPAQRRRVAEAAARAVSVELLRGRLERIERGSDLIGTEAGDTVATAEALRQRYAPPWELALQSWMESVAPGPRSYARPSRRGADRTDVVLAGRRREGWTLHVVLDTSGSMEADIPRVLGAIAAFCDGANVETVHILQCDVDVTADEWVAPRELERYAVAGFGGSDTTPAMLHLARDPEVEAAIVITDGDIAYPQSPMPYAVLWALTYQSDFVPPYGTVLLMPAPA
jgi:hypothetical protein